MSSTTLLDAPGVAAHLRRKGIAGASAEVAAEPLGGGVSNGIFLATDGHNRWVVKQALPRLRVEREWLADPARTNSEADALRLAAEIDPRRVPKVIDLDRAAHILVIEAAPEGTTDWKHRLMRGEVNLTIAIEVGRFLAAFHRQPAEPFDNWEAFEQLRVRPYLRTMMEDDPSLQPLIEPVIDEMLRRKRHLVHGDASPKNVLVGDDLIWLIDFEVVHQGDPAFDVAFMLTHLFMKSRHVPGRRREFEAAAEAFTDAYSAAGGPAPVDSHLTRLHGALLMARVKGRSPSGYLTKDEEAVVWREGTRMLESA